jgi:hypothetical protein
MLQVSIRQHKDGLPSESATLEHGQTLKMTDLRVFWPEKFLTASGSNFVRPAGYVPKDLQKFCTDYANSLTTAADNDSADWLALWASTASNLEMHPAVGQPQLGWTAIQAARWQAQGVKSAVCEKVWPTVDQYKMGFELTVKHRQLFDGEPFTVFDVVELDTNYKMTKLKVYFTLAADPAAARPDQTMFCTTFMNAVIASKNDNSSTWLDLWSRANDAKLNWHDPVGSRVKAGYTDIQSQSKNIQIIQSGILLNAFPAVNETSTCCIFQFTLSAALGGATIEVLDEFYFDTSLLASTLQESSSFNHTAGASPAHIPP